MKAQSITEIIHARSDASLKKHINDQLEPLFKEAKDMPFGELSMAYPDEWKPFKNSNREWIGKAYIEYRDLAFLYLRDSWREAALNDFLAKVEEIDDIRSQM